MVETSALHDIHARHLTALRRAPGTIAYYRDCSLRLSEFLEQTGRSRDLTVLSRPDLMDMMLWLRERGLSPGGEHAVMRGVRAALRFGHEEELLPRDPTRRLKLAAPPKTLPPAVSDHDARRAIRLAGEGPHPLRDRAILLTLLDTGVRMGELIRLDVQDVDLRKGTLRVRAESAKSRKERTVPFGMKLSRALGAYLRKERTQARGDVTALFTTRSGMPLTKGSVEHLTAGLAERLNIPRSHLAPHAWRRAFATTCLRGGVDVHALRLMLGHGSIEQTLVYARYVDSDIMAAHRRASPGDRL